MSRTIHAVERRTNPARRQREPEPDVVTRLHLVRSYIDLLDECLKDGLSTRRIRRDIAFIQSEIDRGLAQLSERGSRPSYWCPLRPKQVAGERRRLAALPAAEKREKR
jgi:hypothetical protein